MSRILDFTAWFENLHRESLILEGWIASELLPHYYWESDIGINVDRDCYEVRLGSKNRILDWISARTPSGLLSGLRTQPLIGKRSGWGLPMLRAQRTRLSSV